MTSRYSRSLRALLRQSQILGKSQARSLTLGAIQSQELLSKYNVPLKNEQQGESWHLAISVNRESYRPTILLSQHTSTPAASEPQNTTKALADSGRVHSFDLSYSSGVTADVMARIQDKLSLTPAQQSNLPQLQSILQNLYKLFKEKDATQIAVSPLQALPSGEFSAGSATCTIDDAALARQPEVAALRDKATEVAAEVEAEKYGLVYIKMEGDIGNIVNGAGLAMATNDAIALHGGKSANFLDAGGQATKATMVQAFRIVKEDARVKTILVNIYGGITNCAMIAESIIGAAEELGSLDVPVVVRLQGTNSEDGLKLLEKADLGLHVEAGFGEAAQKAVELARQSV